MNTAEIIHRQINSIDQCALGSWGATKLMDTGKGLTFKTSGMVAWKGYVQIDYNEGQDLYNIAFSRIRKFQITIDKQIDGVFSEDLVKIIDNQVG